MSRMTRSLTLAAGLFACGSMLPLTCARAQPADSPQLLDDASATPTTAYDTPCLPDPACTPYPSCMFESSAACPKPVVSSPTPGRPGNVDPLLLPMPGVTGGMNAQSIRPDGGLGGLELQNSLRRLQLPGQSVTGVQ